MNTPLPRVAISFPSGDMVHADFALSLAGMCNECNGLPLDVYSNKSSIVAKARNNGVAMAQDAGIEYLLFIDSDMTFPRNALLRLLLQRREVIGATYAKRVPPFQALGAPLMPQPADAPADLVEMNRLPTGFLLIHMPLFQRLDKPYFRFGIDTEGEDIIGEDYDFCDRARAAGARIWCEVALSKEIGHIGQQIHRL
jgi:glycosyltransferase involved in cell wall biosynthesis